MSDFISNGYGKVKAISAALSLAALAMVPTTSFAQGQDGLPQGLVCAMKASDLNQIALSNFRDDEVVQGVIDNNGEPYLLGIENLDIEQRADKFTLNLFSVQHYRNFGAESLSNVLEWSKEIAPPSNSVDFEPIAAFYQKCLDGTEEAVDLSVNDYLGVSSQDFLTCAVQGYVITDAMFG